MLSFSPACSVLGLRALISLSLVIILLIVPLSFTTASGHPAGTSFKSEDRDYFTIHQLPNGETVCREATPEERLELQRIQPSGLRQITHLQPGTTPKGQELQSVENVLPPHLTIILRATAQLDANVPAKAAFIRAAQVWENQVKSPVTIYLDADFGSTNFGTPWSGSVIGSTSSPSVTGVYQTVRTGLISGASTPAESSLYNSMPSAALPTNRGDQSSLTVSSSIARAIGLLDPTAQASDNAARIGFNSAFTYDFDPTNGIDSDKTDFEAVAVHEIGHALGFTSRAGRTEQTTPAMWDLFRFRTGTTLGTFGTAQRIMTADGLQYYFDGNPEMGLSTGGADGNAPGGDGNQSSHWKQQSQNGGAYVGIMDPTIGKGQRRQITTNDTNALNSFGYNLDNSNPPPPPPPPPPVPANNNLANAQVMPVAGCIGSITGTNIGSNKESGEPSHSPDNNPGGGSVWYNWQAPSTGSVNMTTLGSNYDTLLAVYTGSTIATLGVPLAENDDVDPGVITSSTVTFNVTAGTIYRVVLDGWGGETGNFILNWRMGACTNSMTSQLSASSYQVAENAGNAQITVTRADTSSAATVDYSTGDSAGLASCQSTTGAASERCDYQTAVGTLRFAAGEASKSFTIPIIDDARAEGNETFTVQLKSSTGALINSPLTATVTIVDDAAPTLNPIEGPQFFITMQYVDFLGRLPDSTGLANWMTTLTNCPNGGFGEFDNPTCDRVHVSSGFFLSDEFRGRGYWAYRFYEVALDRRPTYAEFVPDMAKVGGPQSPQSEELSKSAYKDDFVQRGEFTNRYNGLSNAQFVDAIEVNAEVNLDNAALTAQLNGGKSRAQLLREIVESKAVEDQFFIRAFVAMQYFGYLRRDPDTVGYNNWVSTLTANPGDFRHMIFGFIYSDEYRLRFGQ